MHRAAGLVTVTVAGEKPDRPMSTRWHPPSDDTGTVDPAAGFVNLKLTDEIETLCDAEAPSAEAEMTSSVVEPTVGTKLNVAWPWESVVTDAGTGFPVSISG